MPPLYVYLAVNRGSDDHMTTKIGCTSDVKERLTLLNAPAPSPGSERRSRHAPGQWHMLLVIVVPRTLSSRAIAQQWARDKRKPHCRFQYGIENVAWHYKLPYFIDFDELRADTCLVEAIPQFIEKLRQHIVQPSQIQEVAQALVADTYPVATTKFESLSFARIDRPRDRYKKPQKKSIPAPIQRTVAATSPNLTLLVAQLAASMQDTRLNS